MPTVLVTGANRGLGLEFVRQYAALNWYVYACCRAPGDELTALASSNDQIDVRILDVADHGAITALAGQLNDAAIDVLINNAGIYGRVAFADGGVEHQAFGNIDYQDWEHVLRVNLFGPMKMAEAFVEQVARSRQKKIITLSSMLGSMGLNTIGGMYAYRTSKAAVNMLMHSMGIDLQKRGILATAVHPGWARTAMGGAGAEIDAREGVDGLIRVIEELDASKLGQLNAYDGSVLPY